MQRKLNDDDVYIIHPDKKHITHKVSSKNAGLRYGEKPQGHKNFASYVDHANKKHGAGHVAMTGRDIKDQDSYKHITEDVDMDQKYQAPFSFASEIAKDFAPKVLTEEKDEHDDGTPKSKGNAFDFKSFVAKKKEEAGENLRNHDKKKTETGAVYKRKEDAKGADDSDTKPAEKRGRGRPAGVYGSYKKRIKEAIEEHALQIDELSKKTLSSYVSKTASNLPIHGIDRQAAKTDKEYTKANRKWTTSVNGINAAARKLAKEETEQIDELSKKTLGSYNRKANAQIGTHRERMAVLGMRAGQDYWDALGDKRTQRKSANREKGIEGTLKRLTKEEVEALEELSKKTLGSYTKKAAEDIGDLSSDRRSEFIHKGDTPKYQKLLNKRSQRRDGIRKAVDRLTKESADE